MEGKKRYFFCSKSLDESVRDFFSVDGLADRVLFEIEEKVSGKNLSDKEFEEILNTIGKIIKKDNDYFVLEVDGSHFPVKIKIDEKENCYRVYLSAF